MHRRSLGGGALLALGLSALSSLAHGQPRPAAGALPEQAAVERWLVRSCGLGQAADATWAAAHVRVPLPARSCSGEARRRCRNEQLATATVVIERVCTSYTFEQLRGQRSATWFHDLHEMGGAFDVWQGLRRLGYIIGQFRTNLLFTAAPDGEALLVRIRDE